MKNKSLLIILTRNPVKGKVKSRLAKDVGEQKALDIYIDLLKHTVSTTLSLEVDKRVSFTDSVEKDILWNPAIYNKKLQIEGELGEKMLHEFNLAFKEGYTKVVLIGSDNIELHKYHLQKAFMYLEKQNVVYGPATDGGYYLIGLTKPYPYLFKNKKWGTDTVLKDSLTDLDTHSIQYKLLEPTNDIDYLSDITNKDLIEKHQLNKIKKITI